MSLREIGDELLHLELKEKYFKKILRISRLLCAFMGDGEERKFRRIGGPLGRISDTTATCGPWGKEFTQGPLSVRILELRSRIVLWLRHNVPD